MPFMLIYALIFGGLVIMETLMTSLVLNDEGAARLPLYYALSAIGMFVSVYFYKKYAPKHCVRITLQVMLAISGTLFLVLYALIKFNLPIPFGVLFIIREVSFLMILMHFPNFAQSYFTIDEYKRISIPLLAGGRIGAVVGSFLLQIWVQNFGVLNSIILYFIALAIAIVALFLFICRAPQYPNNEGETESVKKIADESPLFFHLAIMGFMYILGRWLMNYQYNSIFEKEFSNVTELTLFINHYSQISLTILTIAQLTVFGKFIRWIGVGKSFMLYNIAFLGAAAFLLYERSLISALTARFVENEFRNSFRNPLYQNLTALFSSSQRVVVRSFLQGIINPFGIFCSTVTIRLSPIFTSPSLCAQACFAVSIITFISGFKVVNSIEAQENRVNLSK